MKIIDISRDVLNCELYPGDPKPELELVKDMNNGDGCNLSVLFSCLHTGTHCDAPFHFIEDGTTIEQENLEKYIGPCTVIEVPEGPITGEMVNRKFPKYRERILVKSNGKAWFMGSAAYEAADLKIQLIGTDAQSVGTSGNQAEPHRAFLEENIAVLEGLDLSDVEPGEYFLFAAPMKIGGVDGAPVRAVLISDFIFWSGKN